jgi:hypothetical protein
MLFLSIAFGVGLVAPVLLAVSMPVAIDACSTVHLFWPITAARSFDASHARCVRLSASDAFSC